MLRKLVILVLAAAIIGGAAFWFLTIPQTVSARALPPHTPNLDNGREMFFAGGCRSCHSMRGEGDRMRLGGGRALKSPFGTFYMPNISPDPKYGIGAWSEADFVTAMTNGTSPDGRHYFPAFPYSSYQRMTMDDVRDLFAYLKTLPPVESTVRDHDLPFPFHIRRLVGGWKLLFLDGKTFEPDKSKSAQWNRGAYLVNGPGHCAECHSPRNFLGGIISGRRFAGGPDPEGDGTVPNITQRSMDDWKESDFVELLKTGNKPDGDSVGGSMGAVIGNTRQLNDEDIAAMAHYLKSLPPVTSLPTPEKK
ncbi:MAG TPA: cytochrome c [Xanthobacteraceae bacterium]|nr:cytochrome c [Xanthobacteraceae bacterium]